MRHGPALVLCALLTLRTPAVADDLPSEPRLRSWTLLEANIGREAAEILEARGLIIAGTFDGQRELLHVQWPALRQLTGELPAWTALLELTEAKEPSPSADGLNALRRLKSLEPGGMLTPAVRAALDLLAGQLGTGQPPSLAALDSAPGLKADLADLRVLLARLPRSEDLFEQVRAALEISESGSRLTLTGTELRVHAAQGQDSIDVGDAVVVSLAFWVDGLADEAAADVRAVGFVDAGAGGVLDPTAASLKVQGPGPHAFAAKWTANGHARYRITLSAPGAGSFTREVEASPNPRFRGAAELAAQAESLLAECRLDLAAQSLASLQEGLTPLSAKPRFASLLDGARSRLGDIAVTRERNAELLSILPAIRLSESDDRCADRSEIARRGQDLLRKLPPACAERVEGSDSSPAEELSRFLRREEARARRQAGFAASVSRAAALEEQCRPKEAAAEFTAALASLDGDSGARCGDWKTKHERVRSRDLPRTLSDAQAAELIESELGKASRMLSAGDASGALRVARPLANSLRNLSNARCRSEAAQEAKRLAEAASSALSPASLESLAEVLPSEQPSDLIESVRAAARHSRAAGESVSGPGWELEDPGIPSSRERTP